MKLKSRYPSLYNDRTLHRLKFSPKLQHWGLGLWCFFVWLQSEIAAGFPDFIRSGYHACKACHHDPSGGGPINEYGRTIAAEHLSRWSRRGEEETFYGLFNLDPFDLSGDLRHLYYRYDDGSTKASQSFWMQREVSLAFRPSKEITLLASTGVYGKDPYPQQRRYYVLYNLGSVLLRAGRYLPSFGINQPDHTKATKELFGQGRETLNAEITWTTDIMELAVTRMFGGAPSVKANANPRVQPRDDRDGFAGRLSLFLTRGVQVGGSYALLASESSEKSYGAYHVFAGRERAWVMYERQSHPDGERAHGKVGLMPLRGLWLTGEINETADGYQEYFTGFQFFPRPHWEFHLSGSNRQLIMVSHYYL